MASDVGAQRFGYRQVLAALIEEIQGGTWGVGEKLPTEAALVEKFGVSRNTVREALRELQSLGYLSKRRGMRSVVLRSRLDSRFVNSIRSVDELLEYAHKAHNTRLALDRVILTEEQAEKIGCQARREWVRLQWLRRPGPDAEPFCYSEIYIDPKFEDVVAHLDEKPVYTAIERCHDVAIDRVVQEIEASLASENVALRLNVPVGAPILLVKTMFYGSDGALVEVGVAHFAGSRYRFCIGLDRERGARDAVDAAKLSV